MNPSQNTALRQAEGWRRVAVADAKAWRARALRAEAQIERLRCALDEKGRPVERPLAEPVSRRPKSTERAA